MALKGGIDAATQAEDFRVNRYGFSGGLSGSLQWSIFDRFLFGGQAELLYTPRGSKTIFQGQQVGQARDHYIDLALVTRPEARFGSMHVYLLLGGAVNILMSADKENAAGTEQDITDGLHRLDVALLGAVGIALQLPERNMGPLHLGTMFLEARHDIGLLDVDLGGGFKNRTSSVMLGLSFVVGGSAPSGISSTNQTAGQLSGSSTSAR